MHTRKQSEPDVVTVKRCEAVALKQSAVVKMVAVSTTNKQERNLVRNYNTSTSPHRLSGNFERTKQDQKSPSAKRPTLLGRRRER